MWIKTKNPQCLMMKINFGNVLDNGSEREGRGSEYFFIVGIIFRKPFK